MLNQNSFYFTCIQKNFLFFLLIFHICTSFFNLFTNNNQKSLPFMIIPKTLMIQVADHISYPPSFDNITYDYSSDEALIELLCSTCAAGNGNLYFLTTPYECLLSMMTTKMMAPYYLQVILQQL